jgi:hypothetical protein
MVLKWLKKNLEIPNLSFLRIIFKKFYDANAA